MVITTSASSSIRNLHVQRTDRAMNNAMTVRSSKKTVIKSCLQMDITGDMNI